MSDLGPPWVLFLDDGKPVAILPAMRPGEVADVRHLTRAEAQRIVNLANALWNAVRESRMESLLRQMDELAKSLGLPPTKGGEHD